MLSSIEMSSIEVILNLFIDMSAAFDVVDTDLLLQKLKLYGFDT